MFTLDQAIQELLRAVATRADNVDMRERYFKDDTPAGVKNRDEYARRVEQDDDRIRQLLESLIQFPPHHVQHFETFKAFHPAGFGYEKNVFVMTKFPDGKDPAADAKLEAVIASVQNALTARGYKARIASEREYLQGLWENVEAYLFCCARGVAIVENKYRTTLNPNVAMEWGWMRAMKKRVLYLVEEDFQDLPADTGGLIKTPFSWNDPKPGIERAVEEWLS